VLDALKRTGVADDTLVIFTSDNGPEVVEIRPGAYEPAKGMRPASMGPLRGCKRDLWEGGHRVPFIARWPGQVPAGKTSGETSATSIFSPAPAASRPRKLPGDAAEDSYNILPALPAREAQISRIRPCDRITSCRQRNFAIAKAIGAARRTDGMTTADHNGRGEPPMVHKTNAGYQPHNQPGRALHLSEDIPAATTCTPAVRKSRDVHELLAQYQPQKAAVGDAPINASLS